MREVRPVYGVMSVEAANARSDETSTVIALLLLVTGLAALTFWFVALPLVDRPHHGAQDCEMLVLTKSGVSKCVPDSTLGSQVGRTDN